MDAENSSFSQVFYVICYSGLVLYLILLIKKINFCDLKLNKKLHFHTLFERNLGIKFAFSCVSISFLMLSDKNVLDFNSIVRF